MKKPVIICVDDEIMVLDSLRRELSEALENHFEIETALGGIEALELVDDLLDEGCHIAIPISNYLLAITGLTQRNRVSMRNPGRNPVSRIVVRKS